MPTAIVCSSIAAANVCAKNYQAANCLLIDGNKYCKEEKVSAHDFGLMAFVLAAVFIYIGVVMWIANELWEYAGVVFFVSIFLPLLIIGLILI